MASGINFNNVWAALGTPLDVIAERQRLGEPEDFHAGGSDCSGIVWAVGRDVKNVRVGDEVIVHSGWWRPDDPWVRTRQGSDARGDHPHLGLPDQLRQLLPVRPRPGAPVRRRSRKRLTWEEAGCFLLCASTAYRMLMGWPPQLVEPGDVVLVWGAAGGLGSMALDITRAAGGRAVAVVSDDAKREVLPGARRRRRHQPAASSTTGAPMPDTEDGKAYGEWAKGARAFGKAIWDVLGERISPRIVFEHPGEATLPTSGFVCATGGMIVICAGTTGYNVTLDLRYHWMRQKRFQGSHLSNDEQAAAVTKLVDAGEVSPNLSQTYGFDDIPECHQLMLENTHPYGNMGVLVNAPRPGWARLRRDGSRYPRSLTDLSGAQAAGGGLPPRPAIGARRDRRPRRRPCRQNAYSRVPLRLQARESSCDYRVTGRRYIPQSRTSRSEHVIRWRMSAVRMCRSTVTRGRFAASRRGGVA